MMGGGEAYGRVETSGARSPEPSTLIAAVDARDYSPAARDSHSLFFVGECKLPFAKQAVFPHLTAVFLALIRHC